ncbi:MAG: UvrD-helicase domain-containing protein [Odoribacteraceae bacterium]|jgi:ATP-dependent exoDNAse (exonuclease V) beta subunit|nr:UvrD-helicase domain-containing protein [Odoribacteraceae bacterium]
MASTLKIYKASAGSGKTFALTMEFFKIVFAAPAEYKNVLAVTFTNKATGEMKSRVVKELHKLARGEESAYKQELAAALLLSDEQLKARANALQTAILHDYGRFSVTTIDQFFQRLLKGFARELGIFTGYNVELDTGYVLSRAVDRLVQRAGEDKELGRWITELMERNVEDARSWNVREKILALGRELFGETYKLLDERLLERFADREFLARYRRFLDEIIATHEERLRETGEKGCRAMEDAGLAPGDFKRGARGFISLFARAREGVPDAISATARATVDAPEEWTARQQDRAIVERVQEAYPVLNSLLKELVALYDAGNKAYRSAGLLQSNLYLLGILNDLYREVRAHCEEDGVMLLSDTTHLLNLLIGGNDVSFLFEKCGNFYHHVMIDEFQDTSTLQWANFRPLVANTLANGGKAMLVGDVTQSIYRWRNGDWRLLAGGVEEEFKTFGVDLASLDRNWRGRREIVEFNNLFFREASRQLSVLFDEEFGTGDNPFSRAITGAYDGLEQETRREGQGFVEIHFSAREDEEESNEEIMERVTAAIRDATARGVPLKDCVILARTAAEGALVADYLMEYNKQEDDAAARIPFVSNDSLFIASSPLVKLIVNVLRYIAEPFDEINHAALLYNYYTFARDGDPSRLDDLFRSVRDPRRDETWTPGVAWLHRPVNPLAGSLFEGVEEIIRRLGLGDREGEVPYLVAFQDAVFEYEERHANSIPLFLEWWEKEEAKRVLPAPEEINAVRVLTIHKSKGLEFQVVILPFCCWELDATRHARRVWGRNREEGFRLLEMAPLNYSARLKDSYFSDDYHEEHVKSYVDNLNLLYVALTRAGDELHVFPRAPRFNKEGKPVDVGALCYRVLEALALPGWDKEQARLVSGQRGHAGKDSPPPPGLLRLEKYPVHELEGRVSVRYRHGEFTGGEPGEKRNTPVNEGKLLHELFKRVVTRDDARPAARALRVEGVIREEEEEMYARRVEEYACRPAVAAWFDGRYRVMNERDILLPSGRRARPDRVMIDGENVIVVDYKFGRMVTDEHAAQARLYSDTLSLMSYRNVSSYLWYVTLDKIVRVV